MLPVPADTALETAATRRPPSSAILRLPCLNYGLCPAHEDQTRTVSKNSCPKSISPSVPVASDPGWVLKTGLGGGGGAQAGTFGLGAVVVAVRKPWGA